MKDDTCVICGKYVPEGRQVCHSCESNTKPAYKGFAFVCSPYRGNTERNKAYAVKLTRWAILEGYIPVTPHLYITQALDDNKPNERIIGLGVAATLLYACDTIVVGKQYGISAGMQAEIELAKKQNKRLVEVYNLI